jgi:hypothetical protein
LSTDSITDGVFASTIQAGMPSDTLIDDLDEDAIERSIAEINEAIRARLPARPEPPFVRSFFSSFESKQ